MKLFKLSFLLLALLTAAACNDDDDSMMVCSQSDWVGTYTGTADCDGDVEDVTITIAADGTENIAIEYVIGDSTLTVTTTYDPLPFSSCSLDNTATAGGLTATVDADVNGDEIVITETISDGTATSTCLLTATRN